MTQPLILVTFTGADRAGLLAVITGAIADAGARIRDIRQSVAHTRFHLCLVIDFPDARSASRPLLKDLLLLAKEQGLNLDFEVLAEHQYRRRTERFTYVITLLADHVDARALAGVGEVLARHDATIERIGKLNQGELRCVEMSVTAPRVLDMRQLSRELLQAGSAMGVDVAVQREGLYRRAKRLVVFDMDSTLIQGEVIDELAAEAGVGEAVAAITERAMNGEIDFATALRQRVALLKGLDAGALERVYRRIPLTPGARKLIQVLRRLGFKTAVISGGFRFFVERLRTDLGLDDAYANDLEVVGGVLTGGLAGPLVDGQRKADLLEEMARREGINLDQTIAIGDGANDLPMLGRAGLGIAFNAKARVREQADTAITGGDLASILHLLGLTEAEMAEVGG